MLISMDFGDVRGGVLILIVYEIVLVFFEILVWQCVGDDLVKVLFDMSLIKSFEYYLVKIQFFCKVKLEIK